MANHTYEMIMSGNSDNNIRFNDLRHLLESLNNVKNNLYYEQNKKLIQLRQILSKKYGTMADNAQIWPWEEDEYFDPDHPNVFDVYGN